jgi:hypothetical protein
VIKDEYGIEKDQVLSTAQVCRSSPPRIQSDAVTTAPSQSLMHDHVPAQSLGMFSSYINRAGASVGFVDFVTPTFEFKTLGEMAQAAKDAFEN